MNYSDEVLEHFRNPKNVGEIENPGGTGEVGNPSCGDIMKLTIKVKDNKITDIKFKTFGCAAAIATSSVATELAKGLTLEKAEKLGKKDIIKALGDLPPVKIHCSLLAIEALKKAIKNYKENAIHS